MSSAVHVLKVRGYGKLCPDLLDVLGNIHGKEIAKREI
jgi:hypothetical protein